MLPLKDKLLTSPQLWLNHVEESDLKKASIPTPSWLSFSETTRLAQINSPKRKAHFLKSRELLRHALSHNFSNPETFWDIQERPLLPPLVKNLPPDLRFSLSHSHNWVALVLGTQNSGVDIEKKSQRNFKQSAKIFMSERELIDYQRNPSADNFYRKWCLKEAFYKAFPEQQDKLSIQNIDTNEILKQHDHTILELTNSEYHLTFFIDEKVETIDCFTPAKLQQIWQLPFMPAGVAINWDNYRLNV